MPELPEVQTTVNGLRKYIIGLNIENIWSDYKSSYFKGSETIKDSNYFEYFKNQVLGKKIISINRRAKNILINISSDKTILIHMKMTGHLMYGDYNRKDPYNRHIRLIFNLSNGKTLELCDSRKFAKVTLLDSNSLNNNKHLINIGPEPLDKKFTFDIFSRQIQKKSGGKIKPTLMDQTIIAGIGNIYADESLWRAGIHPKRLVQDIPVKKLRDLYAVIRSTLSRGIDLGGDSMSDYRNIHGEKGKFQEKHMAYRKTGQICSKKNCGGTIRKIIVGGRSSHYCDRHQCLDKSNPEH